MHKCLFCFSKNTCHKAFGLKNNQRTFIVFKSEDWGKRKKRKNNGKPFSKRRFLATTLSANQSFRQLKKSLKLHTQVIV